MAGRAGSLHGAVIHFFGGERRLAAMAQRTLVSGHPGRAGRRDVIGRLTQHPSVRPGVAGLAGTGGNTGMRIG